MSLTSIEQYLGSLPAITTSEHFGYKFFFYGTEQVLPFVTIALADNEHDQVSRLDRDGIFRLNIGVSKATFQQLFPDDSAAWDYTALNSFMPHPHYAAQHFICILNPEGLQLAATTGYIAEAYDIAKKRFDKKHPADH